MNDQIFSQLDFGPLKEFLETDDITDIKETFILNPDKISYIATKLLEFININYGKEQIN